MLGDRLTSCENPTLKKQAQICYICSGNLNKLIEVSNADIQEVVELIVIMQKALELQGIREIHMQDRIASVLSQYAEMLAAEGDLEAALNYLGNSQEQRVSMLRDRLCKALSYVQEQRSVAKPVGLENYHHEQTISGKSSQNTYNPLQQPLQQTTPVQNLQNTYNSLQQPLLQQTTTSIQNWNTTPLKQTYGVPTNQTLQNPQFYGMPPSSQPQTQSTIYDQYSAPHSYNQIPAQPPPPPPPSNFSLSGGSRPSSVGPQSRSKYLIDPSVKSTPAYSQSAYPSSNQLYNSQQIAPVPGYSLQNAYQPQVPMSSNTYTGQPSNFMNNSKELEPYKPLQPNIIQPPLQQNTPQTQMYDSVSAQSSPQMQTHGNGNVYQLPPQASGWNDPPIAKSSKAQVNRFIQIQSI